jgi:hypothetical protein
MTTPTTNLGMSHIQTEFGGANPIYLSEYYGKGGAPASGTIAMSTFRGKTAAGGNYTTGAAFITRLRNDPGLPNYNANDLRAGVLLALYGSVMGQGNDCVVSALGWQYPGGAAAGYPNIGAGHWARLTINSGDAPNYGSDRENMIISMDNYNPAYYWSKSTAGRVMNANVTLAVSKSSDMSNPVCLATFNVASL